MAKRLANITELGSIWDTDDPGATFDRLGNAFVSWMAWSFALKDA